MKRPLILLALLFVAGPVLNTGCSWSLFDRPSLDDPILAERMPERRKKPISGLQNTRFDTEDAMLATAELLLSADSYWTRFTELGWGDDARQEHRDILVELGPAFSRYNIDALLLTSGLGIPLSESPFQGASRGRLALLREGVGDYPLLSPKPVFVEYASADPHFTQYPQYGDPTRGVLPDGRTLRWNPDRFDRSIQPATLGATLLAEVLWARRLLWEPSAPGGDPGTGEQEPLTEAPIRPAVSDEDRAVGLLFSQLAQHKIHALATSFAFDPTTELLGRVPNNYRPDETGEPFVYFPGTILETSYLEAGPDRPVEHFTVPDSKSYLWDQAVLLRATLEYIRFADPLRFRSFTPLFQTPSGRPPTGASSGALAPRQAKTIVNVLIRNVLGMHYDKEALSLVSFAGPWDIGTVLQTKDAALLLLVLEDYLKEPWADEELKKRVVRLIGEQGRFLLKYQYHDGAFANLVKVKSGDMAEPRGFHLETQAYAIRGLLAAFRVTGDFRMRRAAWRTYRFIEEQLWAPTDNLYRVEDLVAQGRKYNVLTPGTAAATIGALRDLSLETRDFTIVERLVQYMQGVARSGLVLSELQATGENYGEEWDFDDDGILKPQFAAVPYGLAPVFASEVLIYIPWTGEIATPKTTQ